ncbi:hypothetical protein RUM44_006427 [Polyplax serrata]|uniref:Uncharacterized protein n=1 Tax=Polyplax serrata TaxID=468196 RepID=A0ABR1AI23_POLSC
MQRLVVMPSIVVHNGSPTIPCSSVETSTRSEGPVKQTSPKAERYKKYKMSLGDEPVSNQHGSTTNNVMSAQRPINCLPVPPPVSPTVKQTSINSPLASGNRILMKSNTVPSRSKVDRTLSKQESAETDGGITPTSQRSRGNPKVKLLQRSHAVREETSPPRETEPGQTSPNGDKLTVSGGTPQKSNPGYQSSNNLQVTNYISRPNSRHKLRHQGSSQGSADNSSPCLSRDSSTEQYTDNSGIDLNQFIADTLNRNYKDRMLLLQIEQDLISLVKDDKRACQKFPVMSSYQRMLVHRVAAFFGMDHNVDPSGHCVVVNITSSTRIPEVRFSELIREVCRFPEEPRRCILKRDSSSFEEGMQLRSPERQLSGDSRRSKSFEEREEEYERARKRIFNRDDGLPVGSPYRSHDINSRRSSHEDLRGWHGDPQAWSSSDSDICSNRGRLTSAPAGKRISKVESFEGNDTLKANSLKGSVSKSYSFGGYPGMTRGDSVSSCSSRALIKQADSVTSSVSSARLSPSSSGYKSQSVRSDATTSTTPSPNQAISQCSFSPEPNTVVWAVSSLTAVPAGAVLINPSSGQPYTNPDGSLYRYDPDNPIKLCPTIEEDTTTLSSPASGTIASSSDTPEHVINDKTVVDTSVEAINLESSNADFNADKVTTVLINSSTSPSLPEVKHNDLTLKKEPKTKSRTDASKIDTGKKIERSGSHHESSKSSNGHSGSQYSNTMEKTSVEVAQNNFIGTENENAVCADGSGNCQGDAREFSGQTNCMSYQVNYTANSSVQGAPEYGSHPAPSGAYLNSNIGATPINYTVGPPYSAEAVHMPPEVLYPRPVVYAAGQQPNTYGVVHAPPGGAAVAAPAPPPLSAPAPAPAPTYETRPNDANATLAVPELSNYFMGLNVGNEQIAPAATPAPQAGYWGPSPNTSQTQGSSHSSQIQMYYVPGTLPTGTIHPKYTPATPSMYTYNVPPVVYPTELCQPMIPSTAPTVIPAPYYAPAPNSAVSYRAPTPPTPSAVTATAVAPTSFFVYHPQPAGPPPPPPIQFGMVRPQQQQVAGIRSSPPPGPRARVPYNRSMSERTRHSSVNIDPKTPNLQFSSSLSMYGLRFVPGEIQSIGMMRPVPNVRPVPAGGGSNASHHPVGSQCPGNDSVLTAARPPRPRKQR